MKLHCPHCGVKGSADDSYSGRKVKCPKCQGLFEVKPDMALEPPDDAPLFSSAFSSPPTESPASLAEVETPTVVDDGISLNESEKLADEVPTASESEITSPSEQEETLDWEDIASEIDLQMAAGEMEGEDEEPHEGSPADLSSLLDEIEKPAGDSALTVEGKSEDGDKSDEGFRSEQEEDLDEIEVADFIEETSLLDPADALSSEEETTNDPAEPDEVAESRQEAVSEDETRLVQKTDEIELEPYGIDKEQCWQCGKIDSIGGTFIAKDGRLYCRDCAPIEELDETAHTNQEPNIEGIAYAQALNGADVESDDSVTDRKYNKISIRDSLRKAWQKTKGAKGSIWAGSAIMYLVILVIVAGGAFLLPSMSGNLTAAGFVGKILVQVMTNVFSGLFVAGLLLMGIRKVAEKSISWKMIFKGFSCAGKIIVATILQSLFVLIGFLFLILPGIYLTVGYAMTLPLIIDKGLSPWQAMETSRKAIHKVWWKVTGLFIVMGLIFIGSCIPLGIGMIWTWPMFIILTGVVYQQLFADERRIG